MSNLPGPGPGRPKNSFTRYTASKILEILETVGCEPVVNLAKIANDPKTPVKVRESANTTLLKYIAIQYRAIEITGEGGGPLNTKIQVVYNKQNDETEGKTDTE